MKELVSPQQSETLVLIAALLLSLGGAAWAYRAVGVRGLWMILSGPLVWAAWQGHKYLTRYDPQTRYFGLDKVKVLLLEVVLFVVGGAMLGWVWSKITAPPQKHEDAEIKL